MSKTQAAPEAVYRPAAICAALGITKQGLWLMRRRGDFPRPIKLGPNSIGWTATTFREWLRSRPKAA